MKAAVISLGSKSSKMTIEAMKKFFEVVDDLNLKQIEANLDQGQIKVLLKGNPIGKYDCIYAKGSYRYATLLRALTLQFEKKSYMPIHQDSFTIGHDKILTHLKLLEKNIPQPKTYIISSPDAAKNILNKVNYPIVFKFPHGTQGKGVMFAESSSSASALMDALETLRQPFLIQEYVDTGGVDIRAFIVGKKVVAAMKRKASVGEDRSNLHAGAKGEPYTLDFSSHKTAVNAAEAIGADICAVDLLETPKGVVVIEVNLSPGLQGITLTTGLDIADRIARFLFNQTKEISDKDALQKKSKILEEIDSTLNNTPNQIITHLDFRGERILLPKLMSDISKLNDKDEVVITASKGNVSVKKYN